MRFFPGGSWESRRRPKGSLSLCAARLAFRRRAKTFNQIPPVRKCNLMARMSANGAIQSDGIASLSLISHNRKREKHEKKRQQKMSSNRKGERERTPTAKTKGKKSNQAKISSSFSCAQRRRLTNGWMENTLCFYFFSPGFCYHFYASRERKFHWPTTMTMFSFVAAGRFFSLFISSRSAPL